MSIASVQMLLAMKLRANRGRRDTADIEYLLDEFVWRRPSSPVRITQGSALRYLADVIYPGLALDATRTRNTPHIVF